MKIRFTESRWLDTEDRTKVPKFKEGSTHDLSEASAYRWTRRGFAVYVVASPPPTLKVGRPMMGDVKEFAEAMKTSALVPMTEELLEDAPAVDKPAKKPGKRKPKGDATVREIKTGPSLPVKGSGKNGGPGRDDV